MSRRYLSAPLAACVVVLALWAAPSPVEATQTATSSSTFTALENIALTGSCDWGNHSNSFDVSVEFNRQRFPNGAYTSVRFAWAHFNPANSARRTSQWYLANWIPRHFSPVNMTVVPANFEHEAYSIISPTDLGSWHLTGLQRGIVKVMAMVSVWNGRTWEYSGWTPVPQYLNSGNGTSPVYASTCWMSSS